MVIGVRWRKVRGALGHGRARSGVRPAALAFEISAQGYVLWFIVIFWLAVIGSLPPAWCATRTSVREVLACE